MRVEGAFLIGMYVALAVVVGLAIFGIWKYVKTFRNDSDAGGYGQDDRS